MILCSLEHLDSLSIAQTIFLYHVVYTFRKPLRVRTDKRKYFSGKSVDLLVELEIAQAATYPVSPWTNSIAKYMVYFMKGLLRKALVDSPKDQRTLQIPWVPTAINKTVSRTIGQSPFEVFFGSCFLSILYSSF